MPLYRVLAQSLNHVLNAGLVALLLVMMILSDRPIIAPEHATPVHVAAVQTPQLAD